jgi:hypothetical protein
MRFIACLLLAACLDIELPPEANCAERAAHWPDADGDGVGDAGEVYIGCDPPDDWVDVPPPATATGGAPTSTNSTGSTGLSGVDTGDTASVHTGDTGT